MTILSEARLFRSHGLPIVGNPTTGALVGLTEDGAAFVQTLLMGDVPESAKTRDTHAALLEALDQGGFFTPAEPPTVQTAFVHVTDRCNLSCVGCYSFVDDRNHQRELTTDDYRRVLDELSGVGVREVIFSGGEPFMRRDIGEILEHAHRIGHRVSLITNGTIHPARCLPLLDLIDQLHVSLDGYDEASSFIRDEGIMPRVLHFVRTVKQHVPVNLIFTLHEANREFLPQYVQLAKDEGVTCNFSIFSVDPSQPEFAPFLLSQESLHAVAQAALNDSSLSIDDSVLTGGDALEGISCSTGCGAARTLISVGADGIVYPCHMLHHPAMAMGDVRTDDVATIMARPSPIGRMHVDDLAECAECDHRYICAGGCRGRSFLTYGTTDRKDPFCTMTRTYLDGRTTVFDSYKELGASHA